MDRLMEEEENEEPASGPEDGSDVRPIEDFLEEANVADQVARDDAGDQQYLRFDEMSGDHLIGDFDLAGGRVEIHVSSDAVAVEVGSNENGGAFLTVEGDLGTTTLTFEDFDELPVGNIFVVFGEGEDAETVGLASLLDDADALTPIDPDSETPIIGDAIDPASVTDPSDPDVEFGTDQTGPIDIPAGVNPTDPDSELARLLSGQ